MDKLPGFGQFCDLTSLHGWKFFPVSNFKNTHVAFWSLIMCGSILGASYIITNHIQEFFSSSVAYNLESPTVPLDEVYFPSVTICNMNALRKSFIQSLMMDPKINQSISYSELWKLVDQVFIEGGKEELDYHERQVVKCEGNITVVIDCNILKKFFQMSLIRLSTTLYTPNLWTTRSTGATSLVFPMCRYFTGTTWTTSTPRRGSWPSTKRPTSRRSRHSSDSRISLST